MELSYLITAAKV